MDPLKREEDGSLPTSNTKASGTPCPLPSLASLDVSAAISPSLPIINTSTGTTEKRVHVSNIPFKWREEDLHRVFSPFGETKQIEIVYNERGSKGFGFVTFLHGHDADVAIRETSGREYLGRKIEVNEATHRLKPFSTSNSKHHPKGDGWKQQVQHLQQHPQQLPLAGAFDGPFNPFPTQIGALLMHQKQLLIQQQLQQYLATQQQTDLIASALGLPTSHFGGLLAGSLPYPAGGGVAALPPTIDPLALQMQHQLQMLQQQQQTQPSPPPVLPAAAAPPRPQLMAMPGLPAQLPAVPTTAAYAQYLAAAAKEQQQPSIGPLPLAFQPGTLPGYIPNEMASAMRDRLNSRASTTRDTKLDRFTPY